MKRADEYNLGDDFCEKEGTPPGKLISMANDPYRPTFAFLLVRQYNGMFSIYGCLRDAKCEPFLTRSIPPQVMRQFLFDAFVGCDLVFLPQSEPVRRCAVQDVPVYPDPEKRKHKPVEPAVEAPPRQAVVDAYEPPPRPAPPESSQEEPPPDDETPEPSPSAPPSSSFLPETDFP